MLSDHYRIKISLYIVHTILPEITMAHMEGTLAKAGSDGMSGICARIAAGIHTYIHTVNSEDEPEPPLPYSVGVVVITQTLTHGQFVSKIFWRVGDMPWQGLLNHVV